MSQGVLSKRIQEQIHQLTASILSEQKKFQRVKRPNSEKKILLENFLKDYETCRGKTLFYPYASTGRGHGPFSEILDGSIKYDLISGIGFNILGHSHPIQVSTTLEAACLDSLMVGNLQSYEAPHFLSKLLLKAVNSSRLRHFWFAGSGSFANDLALKILWQKKEPQYKVIALQKAFAGRSVATQEITANPTYRQGMPQLIDVFHVPGWNEQDPDHSTQQTLASLDKLYEREGDNFCALTLELIQGEAGFIYGTAEYYKTIFQWAKEHGLYIWIDEVQTFARTRELFAFQMFGLDEYVDIVTIGKALQGAGLLYTEELNPKPGLIAGTFNGSLPSIMTGYKIIDALQKGKFYGREGKIQQLEKTFLDRLTELSRGSCKGKIGKSIGCGTMIAFEVGDSSKEITSRYIKALYQNGLISFMAGQNPTRVRFLLPICLEDHHISEVFQIIEKTTHEIIT